MKITNKLNLPPAIYNAVCNDQYDVHEGVYSATTLIKDPCEIILTNRHATEIEEDASESLYALLGSALHEVLERAEVKGECVIFFVTHFAPYLYMGPKFLQAL